jgi:hypothetical protein
MMAEHNFADRNSFGQRGRLGARVELGEHKEIGDSIVQTSGVGEDDLGESPVYALVIERTIEQRFRIASYGSQRCTEFVGNVGHKVFPKLLLVLKVGYVMQDQYGAFPSAFAVRQGSSFEPTPGCTWQLEPVHMWRPGSDNAVEHLPNQRFPYNLIQVRPSGTGTRALKARAKASLQNVTLRLQSVARTPSAIQARTVLYELFRGLLAPPGFGLVQPWRLLPVTVA